MLACAACSCNPVSDESVEAAFRNPRVSAKVCSWQRELLRYHARCRALLLFGHAVADVAVLTCDAPPPQLSLALPGLTGGYKYERISPEALLQAKLRGHRLVLSGGDARYSLLVVALAHWPADTAPLSEATAVRLLSLIRSGATVLVGERPQRAPALAVTAHRSQTLRRIAAQIWGGTFAEESDEVLGSIRVKQLGRGRVVLLPYTAQTFSQLGVEPDFTAIDSGRYAQQVLWAHRASDSTDIYFIANRQNRARTLNVAMRVARRAPELWDAMSGSIATRTSWTSDGSITSMVLALPAKGSVFVVFRKKTSATSASGENMFSPSFAPTPLLVLDGKWRVRFDPAQAGADSVVEMERPTSLANLGIAALARYSGTARYTQTFRWSASYKHPQRLWLDLGNLGSTADVTLNGHHCGAAWKAPYRVNITGCLREGSNSITIDVACRPSPDAGLLAEPRIAGI